MYVSFLQNTVYYQDEVNRAAITLSHQLGDGGCKLVGETWA